MAISGHALALGGLLALTADLRIGCADQPKTKIGLPEINIGMQLPMFGTKLATARLASPSMVRSTSCSRCYCAEPSIQTEAGQQPLAAYP